MRQGVCAYGACTLFKEIAEFAVGNGYFAVKFSLPIRMEADGNRINKGGQQIVRLSFGNA